MKDNLQCPLVGSYKLNWRLQVKLVSLEGVPLIIV
jgi:hypothetical protein